jgi:hypothetical protein
VWWSYSARFKEWQVGNYLVFMVGKAAEDFETTME